MISAKGRAGFDADSAVDGRGRSSENASKHTSAGLFESARNCS